MAGPLGVSQLLLFSRSHTTGNVNLRLALMPRGPTLHFHVDKYSLSKDIERAMKHPKGGGNEYLSPPLLVMNNFTSPPPPDGTAPAVPKHLESLTTIIFQSLFPAISPQSTPLSSIRRVLLLNRELPKSSSDPTLADAAGSYVINLRHYAITTKRTGLSRGIRRLNAAEKALTDKRNKRSIPNLGKLQDVADYLLDPSATAGGGFTSGSESEVETDAEVEVLETATRKVLSQKQLGQLRRTTAAKAAAPHERRSAVEKRAVKLVELGPRMKLRMTKVEEGVCAGKVMWHEFLSKSPEEVQEMERVWEQRRKEKEERKKVQRENVERKRMERRKGAGEAKENENENEDGAGAGGEDGEDGMEEDDWDSDGLEAVNDDDDGEDGDDMVVDSRGALEVVAG